MWRTHSTRNVVNKDASALNGGEGGDALPPGWVKKESKSQKGRYYYVSPAGKTQWTPPVMKKDKVPVVYNWVQEIEIEFAEARLGVSLREVKQHDGIPYPQFQAEVDDLPKVNGKAGPAELYNWGVKPHKRLTIGMRITNIDGTSLAGFTYKEVVDKLKRSSRPLKIKFADADKGTVEDNPDAVLKEKEVKEVKPSAYLQQKQEFTRVLVASELHTEMWTTENRKLTRQMNSTKKKLDTLSIEVDALNVRRDELRNEHDQLTNDKRHYDEMIKRLKKQEAHEVENPEFVKANDLFKRHNELNEDIARMDAGNKKLRKEQLALQAQLQEAEAALQQIGKAEDDDKQHDDDLFLNVDPNATPAEQLAQLRKTMRYLEDDLAKEQRRTTRVEKEVEQLTRHLNRLNRSGGSSTSSSSSSRSRTGDSQQQQRDSPSKSSTEERRPSSGAPGSSGKDRSSDRAAVLEARIHDLRKKQRSVVDTMSKAAQAGDESLARECQKKRRAIKEELSRAQDELNALKADRRGGSSASPAGAIASQSTSSSKSRTRSVASPSSASPSSSSSKRTNSKIVSVEEMAAQQPADKMPTLSGFLDKGPTEWSEKGLIRNMKTMRGARERWCEISHDGVLRYYKRRGDPVVRGEIDLSDASFEVVCEDMQRGTEFVLSTSSQQSHFFTKTNEDLRQWVATLRAANAFLKTNRQLDELESKMMASASVPEEDEQYYGRATLGF
ncbi:hypothetical protein P43SY_008598 [Pythium insidiosum]|uniref:WW domain-containing protein n=1 Tax=Pythium insidiosum TaxID=114742 RepID=A0AAD5LDJ7_PYTIN|nr:hypothetical protein P43SY_008598 [Pythium insidiosum]